MTEQDVTLKEYFDTRLSGMEKRLDEHMKAMEKATDLAYKNVEIRLAGMNAFRTQLMSQAAQFATHDELAACKDREDSELRVLREWKAELKGAAKQTSLDTVRWIALVGLILSVIGIVIRLVSK
jgi:hypothetical protein